MLPTSVSLTVSLMLAIVTQDKNEKKQNLTGAELRKSTAQQWGEGGKMKGCGDGGLSQE